MDVQEKQSSFAPKISEIVSELLRKRGFIDEAAVQNFLNPSYDNDLGDPFKMTDMLELVSRIELAIKKQHKVAVYGDYDIDGVVSTALMMEVLQLHGLNPVSYIPDRYEEGYGLNIEALKTLKADGIDLVITVDCGITSVSEIEWANQNKLDVIITDHHEVPAEIPKATAVVNPRRPGDAYPFKELAGVGVVFAVARALQQKLGQPGEGREKWFLDLVALGTVCDVMPLVGENRTLVTFGLVVLRKTKRLGLVALAQAAGIELADIRPYHLGFIIGPRMNAAGRLEHAKISLDLITTIDAVEAQQLAYELEELNHKRQVEQSRIVAEAEAAAEAFAEDAVLVLADQTWSHGVVGIVASKIAEKLRKPTLVFQILGDSAKGSGRSANGYNLIEGLRASGDLFTKLGGHNFAAGCTLPLANLDALRLALQENYQSVEATLPPFKESREAEVVIEDTSIINWDLYNSIQSLEPFGNANPQPIFGVDGFKVVDVSMIGRDKEHLKLRLAGNRGDVHESIGFGLSEKHHNLKAGQIIDMTFFLEKNSFNNRTQLQLVILALS